MTATRLLRYDALLLWRSFRNAFARLRDIVLLLLVALAAAAWLIDRGLRGPPGLAAVAGPLVAGAMLAGLAVIAGFVCQRLADRRIAWFAAETPFAADALGRRGRRAYLGACHVLAAAALLLGAAVNGVAELRLLAPAAFFYAAGAGTGQAWPGLAGRIGRRLRSETQAPGRERSGRTPGLLAVIARRQLPGARRPAAAAGLLLALGFAGSCGLARLLAGEGHAAAIAAPLGLAGLGLLLLCRSDHKTIQAMVYLGHSPGALALRFAILPAAFAGAAGAGATAAALTDGSAEAWARAGATLAGLAALLALFMVAGIARCWMAPGRSRRGADLQLTVELAVLLVAAAMTPPLAAAALAWRLWTLHAQARARRWIHP